MPNRVASVDVLEGLAQRGLLSERAFGRGVELAYGSPGLGRWRAFIDWLLLGLGAALLLVGVVLLVAFNWAQLPALVKLGGVGALVSAAAIGAWHLGLEATPGKISLMAAAVLVGPLLAVYGQTYQTGADPWQLFAAWTALVALWTAISRFTPLMLLELTLAQVTVVLAVHQELGYFSKQDDALGLAVGLMAGLAWAATEWGALVDVDWLGGRWFPRVVALELVFGLVVAGTDVVLGNSSREGWQWVAVALFIAQGVAMLVYFRRVRRDLFMVAVGLAALEGLGTTWLGRLMFDARLEVLAIFLLGLVVMGEVAAAAWWLRRLHRAWGAEP